MINVYDNTVTNLFTQLTLLSHEKPLRSDVAITPDHIGLSGFRKHYFPSKDGKSERVKAALNSFLHKENLLNEDPNWWRELHSGDICRLKLARRFVHQIFTRKKSLSSMCGLDLGPGENYSSRKGDTSFTSKLEGEWSVTRPALPHAIKVVMNNRLLRRHIAQSGKYRTKEAFVKAVINRFTIVNGDRMTTVPKNAKTDRMIGVGPLWNVTLQKGIGSYIKAQLFTELGYDLEHMAERHQQRLLDEDVSTVDFENASNSNSQPLINFLFPTWLTECLYACRSPEIRLHDGSWWKYAMMSPMGNGFTFEVMTVTLLALARTFDDKATVFGDDVIISPHCAREFIEFMQRCTDFRINPEKTFIEGDFKESCGKFVYKGESMCRFDFKPIVDVYDLHVVCNKLRRMIVSRQYSASLNATLCTLHQVLIAKCRLRGPVLEELHGYYAEEAYYCAVSRTRRARRYEAFLQTPITQVEGVIRTIQNFEFSQSQGQDIKYLALLRSMNVPTYFNRNRKVLKKLDMFISQGRVLFQSAGAKLARANLEP